MRFRWKLFILLVVISLVPVVTARTFGVGMVRRLGEELVSKTRDRLVNQATQRLRNLVEGYSAILFADRERIEIAVASLAAGTEQLLALAPPASPPVPLVEGFSRHIDTVASSRHPRAKRSGQTELLSVSYETPAIKLAPGVTPEAAADDIARLSRLAAVYPKVAARLQGDIFWLIVALDSGVASIYPGHGNLPRGLDLRDQPWYQNAVSGEEIPWSAQYVDPATRQLVIAATQPIKDGHGAITGALAAVVPIRRLLEHKFLVDKIPDGAQSYICRPNVNPKTGRKGIRVDATVEGAEPRHRSWRTEVDDMWLASDDPERSEALLRDFETGKTGYRRMPYQGSDSLWAYGRLNQYNSFLVLITPFDKILEPAVLAQTAIEERLNSLVRFTGYGAVMVLLVSLVLALAFSKTVTRPLNELVGGALRLSKGDFSTHVEIHSKDEFGELGEVFNTVGPQLRERAAMRQSLRLAREVQQTLLPQEDPQIPGLDIAGKSFNCDETGGDYYDYLTGEGSSAAPVAVLVGDVSGHGISSALLMTTARAFLRQRAAMGGRLSDIVSDVNRQLASDVDASGRFMTLFYSNFDPTEAKMCWVRAGHDPAILYDPGTGGFDELRGKGMPLGVLESVEFEFCERALRPGNVVIIGTDGIWESRNPQGEMFGKKAVYDIIRETAGQPALEILQAVIDAVERFLGESDQEDDITLVVIKVLENKPAA